MKQSQAEPLVANALNPDAYAFMVLQVEYREQMDRHARKQKRVREVRDELDRVQADALTAAERATSILETMLRLQRPRDDGEAQS